MAAFALRPDSVRANPVLLLTDSNRDRPAPRVPAGRHSLAARSAVSIYRRLLLAIEPWYDWGAINTFRLDAATEADATEGGVGRFEVQWLGLHLGVQVGRVPAKREGR